MLSLQKTVLAKLKKELIQLRAKYPPPTPKIRCRLCGRYFKAVNYSHLFKKHGVSVEDYKQEFELYFVYSELTRFQRTQYGVIGEAEIKWLKKHWGKTIFNSRDTARLLGVSPASFQYWRKYLNFPSPRCYWDKELIQKAIRQRIRQKQPLNAASIWKDNSSLYYAAHRHFKDWSDALRTTGINPEQVSPFRTWSRTKIIAALKEYLRKHQRLNYNRIKREFSGLTSASYLHFGSWRKALQKAGLSRYLPYKQWSREKVIKQLQEWARKGRPLNHKTLFSKNRPLTEAAKHYFGSVKKAIESAGFNYESVRLQIRWTEQLVIKSLKKRVRQKKPINSKTLSQEESTLYNAARRYFGTLAKAVRAAGFVYQKIRKRSFWSREKVVAELRQRVRNGLPINLAAARADIPSMGYAARRYLGSYQKAIQAAGFNYEKIRLKSSRDYQMITGRPVE